MHQGKARICLICAEFARSTAAQGHPWKEKEEEEEEGEEEVREGTRKRKSSQTRRDPKRWRRTSRKMLPPRPRCDITPGVI